MMTDPEGWTVKERPRMLSRCFMSEKWCMDEKAIGSHWDDRIEEKANPRGFVIMPYDKAMNIVYETQIKPMLANLDCPLSPGRADTVMRTGYIICQKICRPILTADLVVAEISSVNPNVLYELGLSVALERKVLLMAKGMENGGPPAEVVDLFERWHLQDDYISCLLYEPMEAMGTSSQDIKEQIWKLPPIQAQEGPRGKIGILGGHNPFVPDDAKTASINEESGFQLIDALRSQLGNSVRDEICRIKGYDVEVDHEGYLRAGRVAGSHTAREEQRRKFLKSFSAYVANRLDEVEDKDKPYFAWMYVQSRRIDRCSFTEIASFIENLDYLIVDITPTKDTLDEAIRLFWIGYCHGKGKRVIPVEFFSSNAEESVGRSTFDIQGLYYFRYDTNHPEKACEELTLSCQIGKALKEEARNSFWKPFFEEPQLKVFVGALADTQKYSLNEWDYLTLAELNRYLSEAKPTLQTEIISPIYQQSQKVIDELLLGDTLDDYLKMHLQDRNCILIGSADVNIMTELVLAKALDIQPFSPHLQQTEENFSGCVTEKKNDFERTLIFYQRGKKHFFVSSMKHKKDHVNHQCCQNFTFCSLDPSSGQASSQCNTGTDVIFHHSYGFFAYLSNPYSSRGNKILILSGISGPATLALAQMLTGNKNDPKPTLPSVFLSSSGALSFNGGKYTLKLTLPRNHNYWIKNDEIFQNDLLMLLKKYGEAEAVRVTKDKELLVTFSKMHRHEEWESAETRIEPDYETMSTDILDHLNAAIAQSQRSDQIIGAIIETLVEEAGSGSEPCWRDRRRVISWRIVNRDGLDNPFVIDPIHSQQHPFRSSSQSTSDVL